LEVANGLWPDADVSMHDDFTHTVTADYGAQAQSLDYSDPDEAAEVINSWVSEQTRGRVRNLVDDLDPLTSVVLTNSVYFNAPWASPFDPQNTDNGWASRRFYRDDGETVEVSMMFSQDTFPYTKIDGFQILDMPFEGGGASMIVILPEQRDGASEMTPELLVQIDDWLEGPRNHVDFGGGVAIPKFQTTVSTQLDKLLSDMGMPLAFSTHANFSAMTDAPVHINEVRHKAFLEINEQGTEAGAATSVDLWLCFAAGTPVLTPDGEKPIEQLKIGDYVLARDEHNVEGAVEPRRVEAVSNDHAKTVEIQVGGQTIRATHAHPFFVKGQGWTPAGQLRAGHLLATDRDEWTEVQRVSLPEGAEPVFNLRVAGHHTYFVGGESWGFAVWTHNFYINEFHADHTFHFLIRDNTSSALLFMGRVSDPTQTDNSLAPSAVMQMFADSNGDGRFDQLDITAVLQSGKYLTGEAATLEEGDWNGDSEFNQMDIVAALQTGTYRHDVHAAVDRAFAMN
jgi:serine protease inhibitor